MKTIRLQYKCNICNKMIDPQDVTIGSSATDPYLLIFSHHGNHMVEPINADDNSPIKTQLPTDKNHPAIKAYARAVEKGRRTAKIKKLFSFLKGKNGA